MSLFVDTGIWSLALRRESPPEGPEVARLREALEEGEAIHTTGLVLREPLQGFRGPRHRERIVERFAALAPWHQRIAAIGAWPRPAGGRSLSPQSPAPPCAGGGAGGNLRRPPPTGRGALSPLAGDRHL